MKQFYSFFISILLFFSTLPVVGYAAYSISPFPNLYFCVSVYPSSYQTVNFSLDESTLANEFTLSQASKTLILTLPTGFEFNTAIGPTVTRGLAPRDITINSFTWTTSAITVTISTDGSPSSIDHILFNNFQIRAIAAGSGNLLRLSPSLGTFLISGSVDLPGDGSPNPAQSFGQMLAAPTMTYNSSAVVQYTIADINRNCTSTHNPVLEIQVNVTSNSCPAIISQFNFSTAGDVGFSQNPLINITKAKLYYTGQTPGYAYTSLFGSVNAPNGAFTINGSQQLTLGTGIYYFYLTYDVPGTANIGDRLDASMTSFVIDGITKSDMATPNPLGTRNIILGGPCSLQPDVPNPPANLKTVTAGSLVIPMDNAHQNLWAGYPFNIKAYGLINSLLQNDIPVKWVIKSGKIKDGIDFSANAGRVYPSIVAAAMQDFRGGAFIVDTTWLNQPFYAGGLTATQVITAFANTWKVAVYQLTATITVDVRYTLNQRPKIAVFNNGGNQLLQTAMLDSAKYPNYVAINSGLFTGLAECYTFCSESHWAGTVADTSITASVRAFVNSGGNFLAQCKGI